MNPIQMLKSVMGKMNPQQIVLNTMANNNPMLNNLIDMAQKGNTKGVEEFARNFCRERNIEFDTEFSKFMNNFK